ncbi:MAG: hypothetical protein NTW01_12730 [Gammaproteobacteria bacterium]|nr:hypothetical protein [Gammaproteobacteria bacterium]
MSRPVSRHVPATDETHCPFIVIPAQAGIQGRLHGSPGWRGEQSRSVYWIPAFAGMTVSAPAALANPVIPASAQYLNE